MRGFQLRPASDNTTDFYLSSSVFSNCFQSEINVADIFDLSFVRKAGGAKLNI